MADGSWRGQIAAERMQIDQEFTDRIATSGLSSQQWGLVMTAVEFEIEGPADPDTAQLVADTSKLPSVMDEIHRIGQRGPGGMASMESGGSASGSLLDGVKDFLGFGGGDDVLEETAEELAADYATQLQTRLEERGRWRQICEQAQS